MRTKIEFKVKPEVLSTGMSYKVYVSANGGYNRYLYSFDTEQEAEEFIVQETKKWDILQAIKSVEKAASRRRFLMFWSFLTATTPFISISYHKVISEYILLHWEGFEASGFLAAVVIVSSSLTGYFLSSLLNKEN